ncbi:heavy-metal-associated domain-containing protein [Paenibacillus sp. MWE-103]|uniref:Heavy-metal-associated domain-containing protein n=1 Tax=Paenibacillus artemisiicola TaxID=1172618 RepID=A0ABS3W2R6_9BACL|nr:copper ion binding protein [Paenibacillus artemisiicola]MBO7742597.1 heavy-metal-associated domain-containing protein [Paenibacillus artemisiicola]
MQSVTLKVEGMSCNHCVQAVEGAVTKAGAAGKVNLATGSVAVEYDDAKVSLAAIKEAIEDQGYDVAK